VAGSRQYVVSVNLILAHPVVHEMAVKPDCCCIRSDQLKVKFNPWSVHRNAHVSMTVCAVFCWSVSF